jgi:hypothetical protein
MLKPGSKYDHLVKGICKLKPGEAFFAQKGGMFTCAPESFRNVLYQVASTAGKEWRVSSVVRGDAVVWAFYKKSDYLRPNLPAYPVVKKLKG